VTAVTWALVAATAAAVGYGLASVLQASGASQAPGTLRTLRQPRYLAGVALDLLAWLASLAALRTLPVYQVQATLAGSLAVTVLAARLLLGTRLRAADITAVALTVAALAVLAAAAGPQHSSHLSGSGRLGLAAAAAPLALAGWATTRAAASAPASTGAGAGAGAGAAIIAGLAFGGAALCARAITLPDDPLRHLSTALASAATDPLAWALAAYGGIGTLLYAYALEHAEVGPVSALLWIAEVTAPAIAGITLLGDSIRPGWTPAAGAALLATIAAAAVLAGRPRQPTAV
jgi:drug/metabolite transporter (DMT)-like permease